MSWCSEQTFHEHASRILHLFLKYNDTGSSPRVLMVVSGMLLLVKRKLGGLDTVEETEVIGTRRNKTCGGDWWGVWQQRSQQSGDQQRSGEVIGTKGNEACMGLYSLWLSNPAGKIPKLSTSKHYQVNCHRLCSPPLCFPSMPLQTCHVVSLWILFHFMLCSCTHLPSLILTPLLVRYYTHQLITTFLFFMISTGRWSMKKWN